MAMEERVNNRPDPQSDGWHAWSGGFTMTVTGDGPRGRVLVSGELDMLTAPRLNTLLMELLHRGYRQVSVDASALDFCAAAGLNVLCDATRCYREVGGRLLVGVLAPPVRRVLALARVGGDLDFECRGGAEAASWPVSGSNSAGPAGRSDNGTGPDYAWARSPSASSAVSPPISR